MAQKYDGVIEIVVVLDRSSSDGTTALVEEWARTNPQIRAVMAPAHGGIGQARNIGIRHSTGALILCCDGDDIAHPGWISGMAATASDYQIFGGRLDYERLGRLSTSRRELQRDGLSTALGWRPWACGVSLGMWRSLFDELGGFNEEYRLCEDVEFSWRAMDRGYALGFAHDAVVSYRQRGDMRSGLRQAYRDGTWFPRLYRDFRTSGMPGPSIGVAAKHWLQLVLAFPRSMREGESRGRWLRRAVQMVGQVKRGASSITSSGQPEAQTAAHRIFHRRPVCAAVPVTRRTGQRG